MSTVDDGIIMIRVIQGRNMPKMDTIGWCDPYFILKFGSESKQTTIQKNTKNPIYDERFSFNLKSASNISALEISGFDWDRMSADEMFGSFTIPLTEFGNKPLQKWFSVDGNDNKKNGEVELELIRKSSAYILTQHFDTTLEQIVTNQNMTAPSAASGKEEERGGGAGGTGPKQLKPFPRPPQTLSRPPSVTSSSSGSISPFVRPPSVTSSSTGSISPFVRPPSVTSSSSGSISPFVRPPSVTSSSSGSVPPFTSPPSVPSSSSGSVPPFTSTPSVPSSSSGSVPPFTSPPSVPSSSSGSLQPSFRPPSVMPSSSRSPPPSSRPPFPPIPKSFSLRPVSTSCTTNSTDSLPSLKNIGRFKSTSFLTSTTATPAPRPTSTTASNNALSEASSGTSTPSQLFWALVDGEQDVADIVGQYNKELVAARVPYPLYWYPIPKLMVVLAVRTLQYGGLSAQGIFRKSINQQVLDELVDTVDTGKATSIASEDCHAYAVLLKTWLRRLEGRLIPPVVYREALAFAKESPSDGKDAQPTYANADVFAFYNTNSGTFLSPYTTFVNQHVSTVLNLSLKYLIRFLRIFPIEPYVKSSLMDLTNITKLMAPNILIAKNNDTREMSDTLADTQLEIKFTAGLFRTLCITAAEDALFERLDASVRAELSVPAGEGAGCVLPVLQYYKA